MLKYLTATYMYGMVHTTGLVWNKQKEYTDLYTKNQELKPMMLTEKVMTVLLGFSIAPAAWPFFIYNDALRVEFHVKGIDPKTYGIDPSDEYF